MCDILNYICENILTMKALIFAAGLGTRLRPLTENLPKALIAINGVPLIEHAIVKIKSVGIKEIVINVHHHASQIIDFLKQKNNFGICVEISDEREKLLDTGGGIKKASWFLDDNQPFLVHNVDILSNIDLQKLFAYHTQHSNALSTLVVNPRNTYRYLFFDENNTLRGWINETTKETKPLPEMDTAIYNKLAFAGIQIISPEIFKLMKRYGDKFSIMDFYLNYCQTQKIIGYIPDNLKIIDVGKLEAIDKAEKFIAGQQDMLNF